jgi:tripartite-type tricarboxylate transporter receptor subunit TctC
MSRIAVALVAAALALPALAQNYPTKAITFNAEIVKILKEPATREKMQQTMGIDIVASSPEELTKVMQSEIPRWAALVKKSGAQAN